MNSEIVCHFINLFEQFIRNSLGISEEHEERPTRERGHGGLVQEKRQRHVFFCTLSFANCMKNTNWVPIPEIPPFHLASAASERGRSEDEKPKRRSSASSSRPWSTFTFALKTPKKTSMRERWHWCNCTFLKKTKNNPGANPVLDHRWSRWWKGKFLDCNE